MSNPDAELLNLTTGYQPQKRLLSWLLRKPYPLPLDGEEPLEWPFDSANIIKKSCFLWLSPILRLGYARTVTDQDIYKLPDRLSNDVIVAEFEKNLALVLESNRKKKLQQGDRSDQSNKSEKKSKKKDDGPKFDDDSWSQHTVFRAAVMTFKGRLLRAFLFSAIALCMMALIPLLTKELIKFVEDTHYISDSQPIRKGVGYALGTSIASWVLSLLFDHCLNEGFKVGVQLKSVLTTLILKKLFRLLLKLRKRFSPGHMTSLMGTDLSRVELSVMFQPLGAAMPLTFAISIVILIVNIGAPALIGVGVFLVFIIVIGGLFGVSMKYRNEATFLTDERVEYIKEVVNLMKMIKFYSWEVPYLGKILEARGKEINKLLTLQALRNTATGIALALPQLGSMVTFLSLYGIYGSTRLPANIFSSVSSFEVLATTVFLLPMALSSLVDLMNALKRVSAFLSAEEEEQSPDYHTIQTDGSNAIEINHASFSWATAHVEEEISPADKKKKVKEEKKAAKLAKKNKKKGIQTEELSEKVDEQKKTEKEPFKLHNVDLNVPKGGFVIITGLIGSGKSSLLNAIDGNMNIDSGTVTIDGKLIFCGEPWVQNSTFRENITFGQPFDAKKYADIIDCCSLSHDLSILEAGDNTEVGERGITLSGGQKARLNLARSLYYDSDIILLDDVLSAVDARVGSHIMSECFLTYLAGKTRVLATHQLLLIQYADEIWFVNSNGTVDKGSLDHLRATNEDFDKLMSLNQAANLSVKEKGAEIDDLFDESKTPTIAPIEKTENINTDENSVQNQSIDSKRGIITSVEERAVNKMAFHVVYTYFKEGSGKMTFPGFAILFSLVVAISTFCDIFTNTWLSFWIEHKFNGRKDSFYMGIYAMFSVLTILFLIAQFYLLIRVTTLALKNLHVKAVKRLLHTPMSFMGKTPTGRMINRFTKDTDALDNEITDNIRMVFFTFGKMIGIIILSIIYIPWVAIAFPIIFFTFLLLVNYFQASIREIRRLEAVQRSHVFNNFTELLNGMTTIKAHDQSGQFLQKNSRTLDKTNSANLLVFAAQRLLSVSLNNCTFVFTLIVSICCVCRVFNVGPSATGLLMTYVINLGNQASQFIQDYTMVENDMNSAERLYHYAFKLEQEKPYEISETQPAPEWPEHGNIEFKNVNFRYRSTLPLVLNNVNFTAKPGQKIGICGRTGAGKLSIMNALFRLNELELGKIEIDGVDIATLGLNALRTKLVIIPQDPVLFMGTIRRNLDPFGQHSDADILDALTRSGVIDDEKSAEKFALDSEVQQDGANFSLGERQLISFARALLRKTKILILDEATSSVDYGTDLKIQTTLKREFNDCTVLCIAHRLKTILNYDQIITLDGGKILEHDTPWNLYSSGGAFSQMCHKANLKPQDFEDRD